MGCVNKNSKEFKQLATNYGLSPNKLELVIHQYWIERGSEDLFPTDVYMQAQLGNSRYREPGKSVRKLWHRAFSTPRNFSTLEQVQTFKKQAYRFFPKSAVTYYSNAKNGFTVSIKEPVERLVFSKEHFIKDEGHGAKHLDLGLQDNVTYGIDKVQQLFDKFNTDRRVRHLASRVFKIAKNLGLEIKFGDNLPFNTLGKYSSGSIIYNKDFFESTSNFATKAPVLLHELIHALTMYALSDNTEKWQRPEQLQKFRDEISKIFNEVKSNKELEGQLGISNVQEFVAELSNPVFRTKLQTLDKKSLWTKILDAIKTLLGIETGSSYYTRAMNALDDALNAFDINTYLLYNNARTILKQGFCENEWQYRALPASDLKEAVTSFYKDRLPSTTKSGKKNSNALAQLKFIEDIPHEDLVSELALIEQEYADYTMLAHKEGINLPEGNPSNNQDTTSHHFTFKDGIEVDAPFKLNNQQIDALNQMDEFIHSDEVFMTLSGYAGTGKTSLMGMIAAKMEEENKPVIFCATTNKAAAVLKAKVLDAGFDAHTLNKVFGIQVEVDPTKTYNQRNLRNKLRDDLYIPYGTMVIIDEASMINEENYAILNDIAKQQGLKIIYVGDKAQLAPVNEKQISKVFRNGEGKVIELTQVERTGDNAILKEATNIRNGKRLSGESSFNAEGKGVAYLTRISRETVRDVIKYYTQGLKQNPDYFKILAYTNKAVSKYNDYVRKLLGYTDGTPRVGEPMIGYSNWGYDYRTKTYEFINSESYKVLEAKKPKKVDIHVDGETFYMEAIPVTLENSMSERGTFLYMDVKNNLKNKEVATKLANIKKIAWDRARLAQSKTKKELLQYINSIEKFLFINDNIEDSQHHVLQAKVVDFGYALTTHKSQGSTFTHVLLDDIDVSSAKNSDFGMGNTIPLGINWTKEADVDFNELEQTRNDDVDLGDIAFDNPVTTTPNKAIDIRQQLEYVAVSRATDTVTIVSDDVKKEDSPLNHLNTTSDAPTEKSVTFAPQLKQALKTNNWNIKALEQLNQLTKDYSNGTKVFERLSQEELGSGNEMLQEAEACLVERGNGAANQRPDSSKGGVDEKVSSREAEEQALEAWAEARKCWHGDIDVELQNMYGDKIGHGSESWVYKKNDKTVIKSRSTTQFSSIQEAIESVILHNALNPATAYTLVGIGRSDGEFTLMLEQPYVQGVQATQEEIDSYITSLGFQKGEAATLFSNDRYRYEDLKPANVLIDADGNFNVIDSDVYLKASKSSNSDNDTTTEYILSSSLQGAISSGNWSDGNINELNNLIDKIDNGTVTYKRFPQEASRGFRQGGRINEAASIILRGSGGSSQTQSFSVSERYERDKRQQPIQERIVEAWAKKQGVWFDNLEDVTKDKKKIAEGGEAKVFYDGNGTVTKLITTEYFITPQLALDRITLHNTLFPEAPLTLRGFGRNENGELVFVANQPFIEGTTPTMDEIKEFMENAGFRKSEKDRGNTYVNDTVYLSDLHDENVIKTPQGNLAVIDVDARLNTPELGREGSYEIDESLSSTEPTNLSEEFTPHSLSLPNYEGFKNLHEEMEVDAEWKVDLLKELDEQLSSTTSDWDKAGIAERMDNIFKAESKEDLNNDPVTDNQKRTQRNLDIFDRINQQMDKLFNGTFIMEPITASEIRHVAELIVNSISDNITRLQNEEGFARKMFPNIDPDKDFKHLTRREVVDVVGVNNLIDMAKKHFDPAANDYEDVITMEQAWHIIDCWDAFMIMAADMFVFNEDFGIAMDFDMGMWNTTDAVNVDYDNFNISQDEDTINETEGDSQEHWQVESRTIDVINSMSTLVKLAIRGCYLLDKDGNKVISRWMIPERVNPRKVTNSILRWAQGSQSLDDMISKLSAKQKSNPWVSQIINRLSDRSGKEADLQSQFFGVFSKPFQSYSIVLLENGKYTNTPVNNRPALKEAIDSIQAQYAMGQHPLLSTKGINQKLLGNDKSVKPEDEFNLHKALAAINRIKEVTRRSKMLDAARAEEAAANIMGVARILGYPVTEDMVSEALNVESIDSMGTALRFIVQGLKNASKTNMATYDPFKYGGENNIGNSLKNFLKPLTDKLEDTAISAFYDSGKMYQSYVTPSFLTKLFDKFKIKGQEFDDFIENQYGSSEWFKFPTGMLETGWRTPWLQTLARDEEARGIFDHKVELNFNKHNYMRNMTDAEYTLSLITEYFAETEQANRMPTAWFRIPIQSNKPSSDFIKYYCFREYNYKREIVNGLHDVFLQELSRIQTVRMRNKAEGDTGFIKNFDTNGRKFCFLPYLNSYLENTGEAKSGRNLIRNDEGVVFEDNDRLASLIQKKVEGLEKLTADEEAQLSALVDKAIYTATEDRVQDILNEWERNGILEAAKSIKNIVPHEDLINQVKERVENFIWNDHFAAINIMQLTIGDIAFYKDAEDLQKRLSQLHAPGTRTNILATDYEGNRVSDGKYRTVILKDFNKLISNIIANLTEVFDRKIATATEAERPGLIAWKESLVGEDGAYRKINATDAQGFSSPTSYRKKALLFGKWSRHSEEVYRKLLDKNYTHTDIETAFQPLKPFVYTQLYKNLGVGNAPIKTMPVPFQAKNSEFLLVLADAILQGESLSRPNLLRAIYDVMENSEKLNPTKGIDTVQFESAIKSGLQGAIDIAQHMDVPNGNIEAYNHMMNLIYKPNADGSRSTEYNTDVFVHETSYDDYCLQQEVPEHFRNHEQAHGSQNRMIVPSDLFFYKNPMGDHNAEENRVYYEFDEPDGTHKKLTADEFKKEYEETIAESISTSIDILTQELHIDSSDKRERNIALSKILQREILGSPRYGVDLLQACSVDKETGEFRIPKGDPIQSKRIEQLVNSIIKNRVNKQKIAGGPIVQVTSFGTSRQLNIRFHTKDGGLLKTREKYEADNGKPVEQQEKKEQQETESSATSNYNKRYGKAVKKKTYEEYCKENQAGIAYFEVFMPIWAKETYENFMNPDGTIDIDAIEKLNPELLKMIGYRIPTEDKYSIIPMKIVGFLPREAGNAIMQPYDITTIDGSDYDVDKKYVMRKVIHIRKKRHGEIVKAIWEQIKEETPDNPSDTKDELYHFAQDPAKYRTMSAWHKKIWEIYKRVAYYTETPTTGKLYRDNKIVDMTWAVLTNEANASQVLNPGGFDPQKKMGYAVETYRNPVNSLSWQQLENMNIDDLKKACYTGKDLTWADTQIQFYKQNSAATSLIGVFAVNKVAHATLESDGIMLDVDEVCGLIPFTIVGITFGGRMELDAMYDSAGNLIGKTLGSLVGASTDAVKDPILNLMNINMTTAGILCSMIRLGMPFDDAALFLSQDVITRLLDEYNRRNLDNYVSLNSLIDEFLAAYQKKHDVNGISEIDTEALTKEELVEGLTANKHEATDYKVLLAFQKLKALSEVIRNPTFVTRFNSISSAIGPLIVDNLVKEYRMQQFMTGSNEKGTHFYDREGNPVDIYTILDKHPILREFARTVDIARQMFLDMPAGSEGFRKLLGTLPHDLSVKLYSDKTLLDKLSNFYQSYLLIASGMVNPKHLKAYIDKFPEEFVKRGYKEKYPNNALLDAIELNVNKKTGRTVLQINITGMDAQQKEILGNAWIDLHKADPKLSKALFIYNFFRAGIGFSPKTFMALVPTYVKERLSTELTDGSNVSYVDTYRNFPSVNPQLVIDQFIRNNWDNNKLAPWKGGKDTHYAIDYNAGILLVNSPDDMKSLAGVSYMKTKFGKQTYLWRLLSDTEDGMIYTKVKPLGNNGEYIEMFIDDVTSPLSETVDTGEETATSELQSVSSQESDVENAANTDAANITAKIKNASALIDGIMKQNPKYSRAEAAQKLEEIKNAPNQNIYKGFLQNVFGKMGISVEVYNVIKEFNKMC